LRPVPDAEDFDNLFRGTIHNDVRRADKLAGSLYLAWAAEAGESRQLLNAVDNRLSCIPGSGGIVLLNVYNRSFNLVSRFGCPPNLPHE
jgi:hypothetical protein